MEYTYKNKTFYLPYVLVLFVVAFISLGMAIKYPEDGNIALLVSLAISVSLLTVLLGFYLFFVKKIFKYSPPLWTIFIPLIIILINIIVTCTTPDIVGVNFYDINGNYINANFTLYEGEKAFYIIQYFSVVIGIYIGVTYAPKILVAKTHLTPIIYLCYFFVGVCIVASLIMEHDSYIRFFTSFKEYLSGGVLTPKSFFDHRNTWGVMLLIAILGSLYLFIVLKKKWSVYPMIVSFIFMLFTLSKGSIILAFIAFIGLFVYWFFFTYKENKIRNLIVAGSVTLVLLIGIIMFFVLKLYEYYALSNLSFMSRTIIWKKLFYVMQEMPDPLFGLGYGVASRTILTFNNRDTNDAANLFISNTHNIYLEFYAYSGIIGFLAFIFAFGYIVYFSIKKWNKDRAMASFLLITEFVLMLYWMIEG